MSMSHTFLVLSIFICSFSLSAATINIAFDTDKKQASDLVFNGEEIDADEAQEIFVSGRADLSQLEPVESDVWKKENGAHHQVQYPESNEVTFFGFMPAIPGTFRGSVDGKIGDRTIPFNVIVSLDTHAALLRHRLLKKLGYQLVDYKYQPQLKINIPDTAETSDERTLFLDQVSDDTQTGRERWLHSTDSNNPRQVVIQDAILTEGRSSVPQYEFGAMSDAMIQGRRPLRSLIIPVSLADIMSMEIADGQIGESINLFSWQYGRVSSNGVLITHLYADKFRSETTYEDARWIGRKIARFSREDWKEIVNAGHFPPDISALLVEKLIARRNDMIKLFRLKNEFRDLPYNPKITIGNVIKGKVVVTNYPGYAGRFSYGDPESPLKTSEVFRFFLLKGISVGLRQAQNFFFKTFQYDVQEASQFHQEQLKEKLTKHFQNNPGKPYQVPVSAWAMPIGGVNMAAARDVVTGTFYGSESTLQLVDSLTMGAQLGAFIGMDGISPTVVTPAASANVSVSKTYLHIRPIGDIKTALKTNWGNLAVDRFFDGLGEVLESNPQCSQTDFPGLSGRELDDACVKLINEKSAKSLNNLLKKMQTGEMLITTENLTFGANVMANVPVLLLMGVPIPEASIGVNGGYNFLTMRRISIERTEDGFRITINKNLTHSGTYGFNASYFINILSSQHTDKRGKSKAKVYQIKFDSDENQDIETKASLVKALRPLLKNQRTQLLETKFSHSKIDQNLRAHIGNHQFLFWHWDNLKLTQLIKLTRAPEGDEVFNPDEHQREILVLKRVKRRGQNYYGMATGLIDAFAPGWGPGTGRGNEDPANTLLGRSRKFSVTTQGELTPRYDLRPMTTIEESRSGWTINQKGLFKIFSYFENKLKDVPLNRNLVNRDAFNDVKKVHLFQVIGTTIFYPKAIEGMKKVIYHKNELVTFNVLMQMNGKEELEEFCKNANQNDGMMGSHIYVGDKITMCATPWMQEILSLRRKDFPQDRKSQVKFIHKFMQAIAKNAKLSVLLNLFGQDALYFVLRVHGFRTNDENGDAEYISDSIGNLDGELALGTMHDLTSYYGMPSYEINASFFNEGF